MCCPQVYKGLDVATNKATEEETEGVPHHMMGTTDWGVECNVHEYREEALRIVSFYNTCLVRAVRPTRTKNKKFKSPDIYNTAIVLVKNLLFVFKQWVSNEVLLLCLSVTLHGVCELLSHCVSDESIHVFRCTKNTVIIPPQYHLNAALFEESPFLFYPRNHVAVQHRHIVAQHKQLEIFCDYECICLTALIKI